MFGDFYASPDFGVWCAVGASDILMPALCEEKNNNNNNNLLLIRSVNSITILETNTKNKKQKLHHARQ